MNDSQLKLELEAFQGPFDLLLHLIKQMKVDIHDIPITDITQQYMVYLQNMQRLELDQASEYLVMAATLIEIKSRLLLPIEPDVEYDDDYESGDPRAILVQQLLLYQQFQDVSSALEVKQESRSKLFSKPMDDLSNFTSKIPLEEGIISLNDLTNAMQNALRKAMMRAPKEREIHHDPMTVEQKMFQITEILHQLPIEQRTSFDSLLEKHTVHEIITTFMAVLELVRKQSIVFFQQNALAPIEIMKVVSEEWN